MTVEQTVATGSLLLAMPIAVAAGVVSFASPCVLPLVPAYLSYITGLTGAQLAGEPAGGTDGGVVLTRLEVRGRVIAGTTLFVAGFTAVFVSFGVAFGGVGATLLEHRDVLTRVLGAVVIVLGLGFLGLIPALQRQRRVNPGASVRWGLAGAPVLGATFGLGWVPCIGPTLAVVLSLSAVEASATRGAILSVAYCLGLGVPFLIVGLALGRSASGLAWLRRHMVAISRVGGALLVGLGLLLVLGLWDDVVATTQSLISGFTPVL